MNQASWERVLTPKSLIGLSLLVSAVAVLSWGFWEGLTWNIRSWNREEYSHAYLIPLIIGYLCWQDVQEKGWFEPTGSWFGLLLAGFGVCVILIGELSTLFPVIGYGFVITIWGLVWAWLGTAAFKRFLPAFALLIFTVPLPSFVFNNLSSYLQLVSSEIGVAVIRLFDISVYIEGNVIDLGAMKLQVVEACSGLRYLFPLMTMAFIMAMFFKVPMWKRILLFVSSFPVTVLMNSLRIGIIGVLVEYYGVGMAEGFLHDFEGWVVFMAALAVLVAEMWLLGRFGKKLDNSSEKKADVDEAVSETQSGRFTWAPLAVVLAIAIPAAAVASNVDAREELVPDRQIFANFPTAFGDWKGKRGYLEAMYIDQLDFDDYVLTDFSDGEGNPVNLYVAWYDSQRKGQSAHSPKTCLPGGGWRIEEFESASFSLPDGSAALPYNRVLINKKGERQLVYYWFNQRGRLLTNEYLVKWFLFWDALTKNRTDGALIRFTVFVGDTDSVDQADSRVQSLMTELLPTLPEYLGQKS